AVPLRHAGPVCLAHRRRVRVRDARRFRGGARGDGGAAIPPPLRLTGPVRRARLPALGGLSRARRAAGVSVVVRLAGAADAAWLAGLAERTFRETYSEFNSPENMEGYVAEHFGPDRQAAELRDPAMVTLVI